ncbi:MAG: TonB-dependent receptor [Chitinophagales bacterium]|nr:TonB-dependent receptor [Chitinophagales bacterium]
MKKGLIQLLLAFLIVMPALAQKNIINGFVKDGEQPVNAATVTVKGTNNSVVTTEQGSFQIETTISFPFVLNVTCIGFLPVEVIVQDASSPVVINLARTETVGQEVILSASRVPMQLLKSPVSIETLNLSKIKNSASTSYYDAIINLKGVDATTSSLTYKTLSTRGFNLSGSPRVNQIIDGMDSQAPGLNFAIGNFVGLTDLDVESVELLPGASSVLYGPGGMNGTIIVKAKNPFEYKGFSAMIRQGVMNVGKNSPNDPNGFTDISFRLAGSYKNKFAYKISAQYVRAIDWPANDTSNYLRSGDFGKVIPGTRQSDPNYDGIHVYGDETSVDIRDFLSFYLPPGHPLLANPIKVSRTGYRENELVDPETKNLKITGALHYRITNKLEAILSANYGKGQTIYTGSNRYVFNDVVLAQYKLQLIHPDWMINAYTTQSDAGDTYSATTTMQLFNEAWKRSYDPSNVSGSWYPQYTGAFLTAINNGQSLEQAHQAARAFADVGRPVAGSPVFKDILNQVRKIPIPNGGLFVDQSDLWYGETQYDFKNKIKFVRIIAGLNIKKSILDTKGTIFIDTTGTLSVNQWGGFIQLSKKLFKEKVDLSFAGRYDKNENFDGQFTPRFTLVFSPTKLHNFRMSYQTAYRFPTNTDLFLRLNIGTGVYLLGGLPWINDYMRSSQYPIYKIDANGMPATTPYIYKAMKPELSRSFEIGYKTVFNNKAFVDLYYYATNYTNFLGRNILYQPATDKSYSIVTNSEGKVKNYGWGASLEYRFYKNFHLLFSVYSDVITKIPTTFIGGFNTPKYRFTTGITNSGFGKDKRFGMNVILKWQDQFLYERDFATGTVKAFATIDAQVSYSIPKIKSMIRLGGTNITNHYYQNAFGNPMIGGLYYLAFVYNY